MKQADPNNPFHQASFYVEYMKYGPGAKVVEGLHKDQVTAQYELLLREAGITNMTGKEFMETLQYYGDNWAKLFGITELLAKSIFSDGVMHGIAFAAGLTAKPDETWKGIDHPPATTKLSKNARQPQNMGLSHGPG